MGDEGDVAPPLTGSEEAAIYGEIKAALRPGQRDLTKSQCAGLIEIVAAELNIPSGARTNLIDDFGMTSEGGRQLDERIEAIAKRLTVMVDAARQLAPLLPLTEFGAAAADNGTLPAWSGIFDSFTLAMLRAGLGQDDADRERLLGALKHLAAADDPHEPHGVPKGFLPTTPPDDPVFYAVAAIMDFRQKAGLATGVMWHGQDVGNRAKGARRDDASLVPVTPSDVAVHTLIRAFGRTTPNRTLRRYMNDWKEDHLARERLRTAMKRGGPFPVSILAPRTRKPRKTT